MAASAALSAPLPPLRDNGHGTRRIMLFDVYEITLRTTRPLHDAADVLADSAPQEVRLHMLRDAPAERFIAAIAHGVKENHGDTAEALAALERFYAALRAAGGPPQGSTARILWDGAATSVLLDEQPLISAPGPALRNALLLVWLGDNPVDAELKHQLLGQP
ncbi:hypothetical protein MoryE10_07740 [Methylogaea oryzae]|uniref:Chalcone isomerase domain-containing protein n=3 Tax=Methylogaea oryzae TaxID=1295382 RepID=A0A8D5AG99_9GAMM|nr:hypothetical protein MoryE10_07740 [Methylogaea oryzae]